ncbi:MAG: Bacterial regulatory protein, tetR family [Holophagaceae bacterium]|nr:Bacterial regulatory protein, tetR family [Holophagaceae bacterium]
MTGAKPRGPKATRIEPEKLLDAAQAVFARDGLQGASMRAIAREAGCDPALIYYHFQHKEAMFSALLDRKFPAILQELGRLSRANVGKHAAERLWETLGLVHEHMALDPGFRSLVRGEFTRGAEGIQEAIARHIRPLFQLLLAIFQEGVARGEIRESLVLQLGGFFFLRLYMEILDLVPLMSVRIAGIPSDLILPLARLAWFDLFWRGITARPDEDLSFLSQLRASLREVQECIQSAHGSPLC